MTAIANELQEYITHYLPALQELTDDEVAYKPGPSKWSRKEILGHLVDSAQTNIRRFVMAQYEDNPRIVYNQDKWVAITGYQHYDLTDLVSLWYLLNKHFVAIIKNTGEAMAQRTSQTDAPHTIEWLAADYIIHMRHHIHQVLQLETVPYPSV